MSFLDIHEREAEMAEPFIIHALGSPVIKVSTVPIDDKGFLLVVVHLQATPIAAVYYMDRATKALTKLGTSAVLGKDDSAAAVMFSDGMIWLIVSESDPVVNSPGGTSKPRIYEFQTALRFESAMSGTTGTTDMVARNKLAALKQQLLEAANSL